MEKMNELTITDVKEFVDGKKVTVTSTDDSMISVHISDAMVITQPDFGVDGKIIILKPDTECMIELDCNDTIESIHGNESEIMVAFSNNMGGLSILITGNSDPEKNYVVDQGELCQFIKNRLDRLAKLTVNDIDLVLNMEMEFLKSKGIVG